MRKRAALGTLLLAWLPCALALDPALDVSQYAHTAWKSRDGFAKGEISGIAQTSDGYLWLGTGFGLLRFDGVRNVTWQPPRDQHLPSSDIRSLVAARDGTLWIGTVSGLASWKNGKLTQYEEVAGLNVATLLEDHAGSIWVGAFGLPDGKLCEVQKGKVRCYPEIGGPGRAVYGLHEDGKGNLWVGSLSGLWRWRPAPPEFYPAPNRPNGIEGMEDGEDGALLIATTSGVRRLVGGKAQVAYPFPFATQGFFARRMLRDRDGGLWVGTWGRGIVHFHRGRTDVFSQSDGLTADNVDDFFEDREGNIWAATVNGLDRFRELPVVTYSANQGLSNAPTGAVLGQRDGTIWFGASDGLFRLKNTQNTIYKHRIGRARAGVREIAVRGLPDHGFESLF